jgi:hypothetical protein
MSGEFFDVVALGARKGRRRLIEADARVFATIAAALDRQTDGIGELLRDERRDPARWGRAAVERDVRVRRLTAQARVLQRFGSDACLGRVETGGEGTRSYIGRIGVAGEDGTRLLVDWRTPAAAAFFAATAAEPLGVSSRRRYRWSRGRVVEYWDEVLDLDAAPDDIVPDDDSAFLAGLGESRSDRMRDVLATLQQDQDAIIRADVHGPLVVDGGPGTGKTVVALHRAAYLLYAEPQLRGSGGGMLFVGPHEPYLAYVADVLPNLGEDDVRTCTLADLVPERPVAGPEPDPAVARLKSSLRMLDAVDAAVRWFERPPSAELTVETPWAEIEAGAAEWAEAFGAADPASTHDDARDEVWAALLEVLTDQIDEDDAPRAAVRQALARDEALREAFRRAWPVLDPAGVVADLWSVPAFLRRCAPWLSDAEVSLLQREEPRAWTAEDLPLLDAMRAAVGEPETVRLRRRRETARAAELAGRNRVVDELIAGDDGEGLVTMLRGEDAQRSLIDEAALPQVPLDRADGPFGHVVVDEAQELTDLEWHMLLRRCPSRSFTIVGDRAQARRGFLETWQQRLARVGLHDVRRRSLTVNYRTPAEVMTEAAAVIRAALPDANVPTSVRSTGIPVQHGRIDELETILRSWLAEHDEGIACVIGATSPVDDRRVRSLDPRTVKGLEFDLVVLVDPAGFGDGTTGTVDRYVAMTRATQRLAILDRTPDD